MGLQNHVTFTSLLTKYQVRDLIHQFDAAILLSVHEGSPISVKEILTCGKPVIVNDVGVLAEYIIPDMNGYIVDPNNSREVAAAVEKACANAHSMREACVASMEPYDEGVINAMIVKQIFTFHTHNDSNWNKWG